MSLKRERYFKLAKEMLADPIGRQVIGQQLGVEIDFKEDLKEQACVAILTATHRGLSRQTSQCISRLITYSSQFCKVFTQPTMGSSLISWVRNDILAALFLERKPFTHVLWVDDDMVFPSDSLVKMLAHESDIVGSLYTVRSDPPRPNIHLMNRATGAGRRVLSLEYPGVTVDDKGIMRAAKPEDALTAGTGLMLVKRDTVERVGEFYVECEYERMLWGLTDEQAAAARAKRRQMVEKTKNAFWFQLLPRLDGYAESGEDTSFCLKAAMCGKTVVVDTSIRPKHVGEYEYGWDDFAPYQTAEIEKAKRNGLYF